MLEFNIVVILLCYSLFGFGLFYWSDVRIFYNQ